MRTTTTAIAAALLLALTACGSGDDDKPAAEPSPSKTLSRQEQYLETAHEIAFNGSPSDAALLAYPEEWCKQLDDGHSVEWMFEMFGGGGLYPVGDDWGTKKDDANKLLVAGVKAYCPENLDAVRQELRESGEY
jgi:hypothetical protein